MRINLCSHTSPVDQAEYHANDFSKEMHTLSPPWATKTLLMHGIIPAFLKAFLTLKDIFVCFVNLSACLLPKAFVDGPTTSSAARQRACVTLFGPVTLSLHFSVDVCYTVLLPTISPAAPRLPLNNCHRKLQNDSWRQRGAGESKSSWLSVEAHPGAIMTSRTATCSCFCWSSRVSSPFITRNHLRETVILHY